MRKAFTTYNLGCKVNAYELSAISSLLLEKGYEEDANNPDVVIGGKCFSHNFVQSRNLMRWSK